MYDQAVTAGAKPDQRPADMFWGDRYGKLTDPFGHGWQIATHKEDVTPEEMRKRAQEAMAKMQQPVG
jgi:PhnB protein